MTNSAYNVVEGQRVSAGYTICWTGNTGDYTGGHLHLGMTLNGSSENPMDYLDGSRVMPDNPLLIPGNFEFMASDHDGPAWDFDSYYDFAKQCTVGIKLVQKEVKWLFFSLVTIDLALAAMWNLFEDQGNIFNWLIKRFLKYGFILYLIVNWGDMANALKDYFVSIGAIAAGSDMATAGGIISDPTYIVQKGAFIIGPIFTYIASFNSVYAVINNIVQITVALILAFAILACFIIIGFEIMMAYLEFYVIASLSVVTMGFGGLQQTKFFAEKGLAALIQVSMKLMIFSFIGVMLSEAVKDYGSVVYEFILYLKILLGSITFVCLFCRSDFENCWEAAWWRWT